MSWRRFIMMEIEVVGLGAIALLALICWQDASHDKAGATITIKNVAKRDIRVLTIVEERSRIVIPGPLKPGSEVTRVMRIRGESAYHVEVIFSGGTKVIGVGAYVQAGYRCINVIHDDRIENSTNIKGMIDRAAQFAVVVAGILAALAIAPFWAWIRSRRGARAV